MVQILMDFQHHKNYMHFGQRILLNSTIVSDIRCQPQFGNIAKSSVIIASGRASQVSQLKLYYLQIKTNLPTVDVYGIVAERNAVVADLWSMISDWCDFKVI